MVLWARIFDFEANFGALSTISLVMACRDGYLLSQKQNYFVARKQFAKKQFNGYMNCFWSSEKFSEKSQYVCDELPLEHGLGIKLMYKREESPVAFV